MASINGAIREYGPPPGAPGIKVREVPGVSPLADANYGAAFFLGVLKRGPEGVAVPVSSKREYNNLFGDPNDERWHLFDDGAHQMPDAIDGYFRASAGRGTLWVTRLPLERKSRPAKLILKNRLGGDALEITAANGGRWGGAGNEIPRTPVIVATTRTFTLFAPGVESNEFDGADAQFTSAPGRLYRIVGNTAANPTTGEVIFTVAAQYNLLTDGISGPTILTGTASYNRYTTITGTVAFPLQRTLTGTVTIVGNVVAGAGTDFVNDLVVGQNLYWNGEARRIESITSNTTATIAEAFSQDAPSGTTVSTDNLEVTGTGTNFTTDLSVGDTVYYSSPTGDRQGRKIAAITSNTKLTLVSGFSTELTAGSQLTTDSTTVSGTGTNFLTECQVGQWIVDPNRRSGSVKIVSITSATSLKVERPFADSFTNASITKQNQFASVTLASENKTGLEVKVGQGLRNPAENFSLEVFFNGSKVLQIDDASLDPTSPVFVDEIVEAQNIGYRTDGGNYPQWIRARSLWESDYTTSPGMDVRPANGSGRIVAIEANKAWVYGQLDYNALKRGTGRGGRFYPNPYSLPRQHFSAFDTVAQADLTGTISSSGTTVNGVGTLFTSELTKGDYLYDPRSQTARKVRLIQSDTLLYLEKAFAVNLPALTKGARAGLIILNPGADLSLYSQVGNHFIASYTEQLRRGYDGDLANTIPYHWIQFLEADGNEVGGNFIERAVWGQNLGLVRIACPGISDVSVQKAGADYAAARAFEYRVEVPLSYNSAPMAENFINEELGRSDFVSAAFPSYCYVANPFGAGKRLVTLSGLVMGKESYKASVVQGYHDPAAGVNEILPGVLSLPFKAYPEDEAVINVAGLQTIKMLQGNAVIWGVRAPSINQLWDFLHIRRTQSNYIRIFLEARSLFEVLFRTNSPRLQQVILMKLDAFFANEYRKGAINNNLTFQQAVFMDSSAPTQNVVNDQAAVQAIVRIIQGKLDIDVRWVPAGVLEQLSINLGPDVLSADFGSVMGRN
jgi:hypothetical protein